jgi:hypothetical protein
MIAKNVFDGAKRRLVTPIEKKEAITFAIQNDPYT